MGPLQVETKAHVASATTNEASASARHEHARLLSEVTELRRRLAGFESVRAGWVPANTGYGRLTWYTF